MTRNIIGSIKLEPDASAPSAAKGVIYYDSGTDKLQISEDGSTFVDVGLTNLTGVVTSVGAATSIADKALSTAKLADGTDGELITWDAAGVIAHVAAGTATQVLTSNGPGAAPTFQAAGGGGGSDYDAVVIAGGGGDYTTLGAAITAGHKYILIKDGTTTETGAITLASYTTIVGESPNAIVSMGTNLFTTNTYTRLDNFRFTSTLSTNQLVIGGQENIFTRMWFWNGHTSNPGPRVGIIADAGAAHSRVIIDNCFFVLVAVTTDMDNRTGIYQTGAGYGWKITNCKFVGENSTIAVMAMYFVGDNMQVVDCSFESIGQVGNNIFYMGSEGGQVSNLAVRSSAGRIYFDANNVQVSNITTDSAMDLYVINESMVFSQVTGAFSFDVSTLGHYAQITNCAITGAVSVASDGCIISNSRVGAIAGGGSNTITFVSGADNNICIGCRTDAAISDSGTGNVLTSNVVY